MCFIFEFILKINKKIRNENKRTYLEELKNF